MSIERLRGLRKLIEDVVEHGSRAVERVQKETARRPFEIVEAIPAIGEPARVVHVLYDASVGGVHTMIRLVNRAVGTTLEAALDVAEDVAEHDADAERDARTPPPAPRPNDAPARDVVEPTE